MELFILGKSLFDDNIYIAESCHRGYQIVTFEEFKSKYSPNGDIRIFPNDGKFSDIEVAQRAIQEIQKGGNGSYNLITNNCESFSNRAMHDNSLSNQVINTALGSVILIGAFWYIKNTR